MACQLSIPFIGPIANEVASSRYCQGIQITLRVVRARCADSPIRNFAEAEYPNVATLILNMRHPMHMTRRDTARATSRALRLGTPYGFPSSTTQLQTGTWLANRGCSPNTTFWRAILNGRSFPDLKRIEIYHAPGAEISEVERRRRSRQYSVTLPTPDETAAESYHSKDSSSSGHGLPTRFVVGELDSLKTLEELILSLVPELNDSILLETTKFATALTTLDIRNCPLSMLGEFSSPL